MADPRIKVLEDAVAEADRFQAAALKEIRKRRDEKIYVSREGGACRRASMDLSNALVKVRAHD